MMALIQSEDERDNEATKGTYLEGIFHLKLFCFLTHFFFLSCCLIGLRIGQVRLIFTLLDYLRGNNLPRYHTCIEWHRCPRGMQILYSQQVHFSLPVLPFRKHEVIVFFGIINLVPYLP